MDATDTTTQPMRVDFSHGGIVRLLAGLVGVAMALYHMWAIVAGAPEAIIFRGTHLLFAKVPEVKAVKNRLHLDLRPENQDAEVERVLALGAKKVDIGQGQQTWVVLADPEGNEFCILRNLTPEERAEREKRDAV